MKTAICISTYNGEKYITQQINSLLNQTYSDFEIWIRDDCSSDLTVESINKINDSRIHLVKGKKNIGFKKSFCEILRVAEGDFFFFCDQDDYWEPNKLREMINKIMQCDNSKPLLLFSDAYVVDSDLQLINNSFMDFQKLDPAITKNWKNLLAQNVVLGCSTCFNKKAKDLFINYFTDIMYHDHLIAVLVAKYGEIEYLNTPLLKYRQHFNNVIGSNNFSTKYIFKKIRTIQDYLNNLKQIVLYFGDIKIMDIFVRKIFISISRLIKR